MGELKGCLQTILREEAVAPGPNDEGLVTLSEESGTSMHVQISHVPSTTTVVSLQQESQYSVLRKAPGKSWRRKCDFILVDEDAGDCKVVMVELKSTLGESQYGLEQLRRSLPMAKYILTACEVELQRSWPCRFSYALIAEKRADRLDKQRTRPSAGPQLSTEDYKGVKVVVGVGTRFDFRDLIAGR